MKTVYLIFLFMTFSGYLLANQPDSAVRSADDNGWVTVEWSSNGYIYPNNLLEVDNSTDSIILTVNNDKFITRICGLLLFDIDSDKTATPDTPVLAPSINRAGQDDDLWIGKAKQVVLPYSKNLIKNLTIVLADEASLKADSVVMLSHEEIELEPGEQVQLVANYTYEGIPQSGIAWNIDNTDVAEIDSLGLLTALTEGTAKVTATTTDGRNLYATCALTVVKKAAVLPGDVNNDGIVAVNDVVLAINAVLGQTPEGFVHEAADMSGDGQIMVNDVVLMINVILGVNPSASQVRQFLNSIQN